MAKYKLGLRIGSLSTLARMVKEKKSLICPIKNDRPIPASVTINMPGHVIYKMFIEGLYIYKKQ